MNGNRIRSINTVKCNFLTLQYIGRRHAIHNWKCTLSQSETFLSLGGISLFLFLQVQFRILFKRLFDKMSCCLCTHCRGYYVESSNHIALQSEAFKYFKKKRDKCARALDSPIIPYMQLNNEILIGGGWFCCCKRKKTGKSLGKISFLQIRISRLLCHWTCIFHCQRNAFTIATDGLVFSHSPIIACQRTDNRKVKYKRNRMHCVIVSHQVVRNVAVVNKQSAFNY